MRRVQKSIKIETVFTKTEMSNEWKDSCGYKKWVQNVSRQMNERTVAIIKGEFKKYQDRWMKGTVVAIKDELKNIKTEMCNVYILCKDFFFAF